MTKKTNGALVKETKALIKEVEAGNTDHAAWVAIQDRVKLLAASRTHRQVGASLDKDATWVTKVLQWRGDDHHHLPLGGPKQDVAQSKSRAKKALRDPEIRAKVIADLKPEERAKVASEAVRDLEADERAPVQEAIREKERREFEEDPSAQRAHRRNKERTFVEDARHATEKAFDHLAARVNFYADVPLDEKEVQYLGWIQRLTATLQRGADMDDELKEILDEAAA